MLRMESETGWWLIRHPDHAELAGAFAAAWGNEMFRKPEPRERVLFGIARHDDGWVARDAHLSITRQGKPSAFSTELVTFAIKSDGLAAGKCIFECFLKRIFGIAESPVPTRRA